MNKLSLLDEVGIDMADIGRNCWFLQVGWLIEEEKEEVIQGSRKRSGTLAWLKERSNSRGLYICLT